MTGGVSQDPRCYVVVYLSLRSGEFTNISSNVCGSWHLPIFLFRDGSLTLLRIESLMHLVIVLVLSAHNTEVVNGSVMTSGVVMVTDRWGGLHIFFESFYKCSAWLHNIFLLIVHPATCVSIYHPTSLDDGVSVLGVHLEVLDGASSPEVYLNVMFSCSFHLVLWYRAPLYRACCLWCLSCSWYYWSPCWACWFCCV